MGFFDHGIGRIAAGAATLGGSEAYRELSKPGNLLGPNDVPATAPADPANAQLGAGNGTDLSNQLAAQAYASGLDQQAGQNDREGAFYNQANGNFDIANAAQMRQGPQISANPLDQARQLTALQSTQSAGNSLGTTGNQLTDLGTRPMGDSYAAAQLAQGQAAAQAQQLSAARSGRSLGSGQAAMNQAMFNNAATNQVTNQQAASARIQEQNAYNQFQVGALGAAGQQYGAQAGVAASAGQQASTIRSGNEGVQAQNAGLNLQQQQTNNQTTGLYNQLGSNQQNLGMQANGNGLQASQFGAQRNDNIMGAQLQANTSLNGTNAQINMANNAQANASQTAQKNATVGLISSGLGAAATASKPATASDERVKTKIIPLEPFNTSDVGTIDPVSVSAAPVDPVSVSAAPGTDPSQLTRATNFSDMSSATALAKPGISSERYMDAINAANTHYASSRHAPVDVLNHVPGAGAGPSDSQSALLAHMKAQSMPQAPRYSPIFGSSAALPTGGNFSTAQRGPMPLPAAPITLPNGAQRVTSDQHSKTRIRELESQLEALSGAPQQRQAPPTARFAPEQPDTARLDAYRGNDQAPAIDLRPARGYEYEYLDPNMPGAAPGRHTGPMAQDLLKSPATAATVQDSPTGLQVDTPRLTMVNTAAISEQQRKNDDLQAQLDALSAGNGGYSPAPYNREAYRGAGPL